MAKRKGKTRALSFIFCGLDSFSRLRFYKLDDPMLQRINKRQKETVLNLSAFVSISLWNVIIFSSILSVHHKYYNLDMMASLVKGVGPTFPYIVKDNHMGPTCSQISTPWERETQSFIPWCCHVSSLCV